MNIFQEFKEAAREETLNELSQGAMIQKAIDIATSMGGNMTGAVKRIEKIKRGLSKNKNVANALRLANEEVIGENYRTAARHGMGTEGKKEARVGLELDYYDREGVKHMGKIVKKDSKGYTVKDDKTGKMHTFVYHDRIKARKFLQKMGDNLGEGAVSAAQRAAIAISKKEKAGKPGYDKEGKSLKKESVMDVYRKMWEDASDIVEVTDKEINAMKQLSKDAEKIKKNYQKIVNMGDKELKDRKYNKEYEDILKMQQSVLSLIGKLSNQKMINKESLEEKLSKADLKMIDQMYDKKGNLTDVGKAVMNYKPGDNIQKILQKLNKK